MMRFTAISAVLRSAQTHLQRHFSAARLILQERIFPQMKKSAILQRAILQYIPVQAPADI